VTVHSAYMDPRIQSLERLMWQLAGLQPSSRANHELRDRIVREFERDFPLASPADRERFMSALRRATNT